MRRLTIATERFPIAGAFTIARGAAHRGRRGHGRDRATATPSGAANACPMPATARPSKASLPRSRRSGARSRAGSTASALQEAMPPGAARNALDCALWDLDAKRSGVPAHVAAGTRPRCAPVTTAYTISLGDARGDGRRRPQGERPADPQDQARRRRTATSRGSRPCARAAPDATLIADANEGWSERHPRPASRGLRRGGRRAHRAAAAGREGRGAARRDPPAGAALRRRERARPSRASAGLSGSTTRSTSSSTRPAA